MRRLDSSHRRRIGVHGSPWGFPELSGESYFEKILSFRPGDMVGYWTLQESALNSQAFEQSPSALHGAHDLDNVLLGPNKMYLAGSGMVTDCYSAALAAKFDGDEGGAIIRSRMHDATIWTDGNVHRCFSFGDAAGVNQVTIRKDAVNNRLGWRRWANAVASQVNKNGLTTVGEFIAGATWSKTADEFIAYFDGAQEGAIQNGLNAWVGVLHNTRAVIGANDNVPTNVWNGWLGDMILVFGVVPTGPNIATVTTALEDNTLFPSDLDGLFGIGNWAWWKCEDVDVADLSGNFHHARGVGVTPSQGGIGDGLTSFLFNGVNNYVNIWSPQLRDAFDKQEGGMLVWTAVPAGAWTDGTARAIVMLQADAANRVLQYKRSGAADDILELLFQAGGDTDAVNSVAQSSTDFMCHIVTWSNADDEIQFFLEGSLVGVAPGIGTWVGDLNILTTAIGAAQVPNTSIWDGNIQHVVVWGGAGVPAALQAEAPRLSTV